jgi:virginiamycin B lyase
MNMRTGLVLLALLTAGCGGGGHSGSTSVPVATGGTQSGTLSLTFAAPVTASAVSRTPLFVSPNAATAIVAINSGTAQTFSVGASSTLCTTANNVRTCAIPLTAPFGADSMTVSLMGTVSGNAVLLGQGSNSITVTSGTNFSLTVGINPVVAGINVGQASIPSGTAYAYGTPSTQSGTITFADPSDANITGSGNVPNFLQPVTFTSSDPHVSIVPATLTTPGQGFNIGYDGSAAIAQTVTVTAMVGTMTLASAQLAFPGLIAQRFNLGAIGTIAPQQMANGPDGNVWVALQDTNDIARITPAGVITTFPTGIGGGTPVGVVNGGDGNIYFGDSSSCTISRINPTTLVTGPSASVGSGCSLWQMGLDGSGNIWFIDEAHNEVGYIPTSTWPSPGAECGALPTSFSFSIHQQIAVGADAAMWFTEGGNGHKVGRYASTTACGLAQLTEYTPPSAGNHDLGGIALGADNNLWITELLPDLYAKVTTGGAITEYPGVINSGNFGNPDWIAAGSDGQLWIPQGGGAVSFKPTTPTTANLQLFVNSGTNTNGQTDNHYAMTGPDGDIWFNGQGQANGGGFTPTQDSVVKFVPR